MHVQSVSGFACSYSNLDPLTPGTLVLPTVQPTYDQGTLQSVENYLTAVSTGGDRNTVTERRDTVPYPAFSANPDAFQLVPVTGTGIGNGAPGDSCDEIVHITNIGNAPIHIAQVSAQFTTDTHANTQHYNLIDVCSFVPPISVQSQACLPLGGGGEGGYLAFLDLHPGKASTTIPARSWENQAPTLQPGDVVQVIIFYKALDNRAFSASIIPTFTLAWPGTGKQTTYPAPQLQETLAFASASQFSCYALQGQHFSEVPQGVQHWCI